MSWWWPRKQTRFQVAGDDEDFLLVTWDSCRFDAYLHARTPVLDSLCEPRRAWAQGTYTLPAHVAMFRGFLPHAFTAEPFYNRFRRQLWRVSHRNLENPPLVCFPSRTPGVVPGLRSRGYYTVGTGAMDWFRDADCLREGFEDFWHSDTNARRQDEWVFRQIERKAKRRPVFAFLNYGETHSPFRYEGMPAGDTRVDARFRRRNLYNQQGALRADWTFDEASFARQVACAEYLDGRMGVWLEWLQRRGRPTTVVVCADHGECFGEDGLYGHAIYHEKVMEVPLLIFRLNAEQHAGLVTHPSRVALPALMAA